MPSATTVVRNALSAPNTAAPWLKGLPSGFVARSNTRLTFTTSKSTLLNDPRPASSVFVPFLRSTWRGRLLPSTSS